MKNATKQTTTKNASNTNAPKKEGAHSAEKTKGTQAQKSPARKEQNGSSGARDNH